MQGSVPVNRPLTFDIPSKEHSLFTAHAPFFARWGITYTLLPGSRHQLSGTVTPARPTTEQQQQQQHPPDDPHLTPYNRYPLPNRSQDSPHLSPYRSLVPRRQFFSLLLLPPSYSASAPPPPPPPPPQGLRDMLASRACRSAIMFNDVLKPGGSKGAGGKVGRHAETMGVCSWETEYGAHCGHWVCCFCCYIISSNVGAGTGEALTSGLHGMGRQEGREGSDGDGEVMSQISHHSAKHG